MDLCAPWCFEEGGASGGGGSGELLGELMDRLHIPRYHGGGGGAGAGEREAVESSCPHCSAVAAAAASSASSSSASSAAAGGGEAGGWGTRRPFPASLLVGSGIIRLCDDDEGEEEGADKESVIGGEEVVGKEGNGSTATVNPVDGAAAGQDAATVVDRSPPPSTEATLSSSSSSSSAPTPAPAAVTAAAWAPFNAAAPSPPDDLVTIISGAALARRRQSFGDDGLGGIDDTDDVTGGLGPLLTTAPSIHHAGGIAATAQAAAKANMNSLAVRLALPVAAAGTDVEGMAAEAKFKTPPFAGHVLVCGVSDSIGYLLRGIASQLTHARRAAEAAAAARRVRRGSGGRDPLSLTSGAGTGEWVEGEQYDLVPTDIVVLAAGKPSDANVNAMYAGR